MFQQCNAIFHKHDTLAEESETSHCHEMENMNKYSQNFEQLKASIKQGWDKISSSTLQKLISSAHKHLQSVGKRRELLYFFPKSKNDTGILCWSIK